MSATKRILTTALITSLALMLTNPCFPQFRDRSESDVKVSARFHIQSGTDQGFLIVKVEIAEGSYIYSLTQPEPLIPSKIVVKSSKSFVAGKNFKSDNPPKVIEKDPVFQARLEKHSGTVQFYAPIRLASASNLKSVQPEISFSGQVCSEQGYCIPLKGITAKAKFAGFFEREAKNSVPPLIQKK